MQFFLGLRDRLLALVSGPKTQASGDISLDPDGLRIVSAETTMGPRATVAEATCGSSRFLLKKWLELPIDARRDLVRLLTARQQQLSAGRYLPIRCCGEKVQERRSGYVFCIQDSRPRTLRRYLKELENPCPLAVAAHVVREVARAVGEAHAHNIVHGNLGPDAVYVETASGEDTGNITVDFACFTGMDYVQDAALTLRELYPMGRGYLAPEALLGNPPDELSDLYTMGVLAYQIFTGQLPFGEGASTTQKVKEILSAQLTPPGRLRSDIPNRWEAAILRLLSKDRKHRYRTAEDFLSNVESSLS